MGFGFKFRVGVKGTQNTHGYIPVCIPIIIAKAFATGGVDFVHIVLK